MKKLLFLMLTLSPIVANAQEELDSLLNAGYELTKTYSEEEIKTHAVMPEFPGGKKALNAFIRKNLKYPSLAVQNGFEGMVHLKFDVEEDGSITDLKIAEIAADSKSDKFLNKSQEKQAKIKEKVEALYAKEALRLVKKMPKWKPGTLDNEPKCVHMTLPITFIGY